jgi:hypothetical protein
MHVDKTALLEKLVDRIGHAAAHAEDRAIEIRARAKVGDAPEELGGVAFFLERIILRHTA